ncbi:MAG: SAM-dependent methyltransferase [Clostridiales bacterium]|nr:SAM-dependent methyltransferase [Clostridiales bacterium]
MAFIMPSLSRLATSGTAAIACFPGIMYRSGAKQKIRMHLVYNNYTDCIITSPQICFSV